MTKPIVILGISCDYHDSAAALICDGEIIFAAHEERFSRKKHDAEFPRETIKRALREAKIDASQIDAVAYYEKPLLKFFDRIIPTFIKVWPRGFLQFHLAMQDWIHKKLWIKDRIHKELGCKAPVYFTQHHESHAASAFFCSGFPDATIVTIDGVGEWATTTIGYGKGTQLTLKEEIHYPHSLGLLYSSITYYLGFKVNSAEYKVMGLAPYGEPRYVDMLRRLIDVKDDGSFRLTMKYFTFEHGLAMTGTSMEKLLGAPRRKSDEPLTQFHKDIARSLQALTEEIMMRIVRHAKDVCPSRYLCLAGGVALNCVANGKIVKEKLFDEIFIQPAAGDAGGALGAALMVWHKKFDGKRLKKMDAAYLGNTYSPDEIERQLMAMSLPYKKLEKDQIPEVVASLLENNRVIGLFQGKMEFGPRALGNRSIIADARKKDNWQRVNLKIKFREDFRPFAPTVLMEDISRYFNLNQESPYMLLVADVHPDRRSEIPAVTHVDGSARIQTIQRAQNPMYYDIIQAFRAATNCSVIINTSFNIRGEPIVESPRDAIRCFLHTDIDNLLLENFLLSKEEMPARGALDRDAYVASFALD